MEYDHQNLSFFTNFFIFLPAFFACLLGSSFFICFINHLTFPITKLSGFLIGFNIISNIFKKNLTMYSGILNNISTIFNANQSVNLLKCFVNAFGLFATISINYTITIAIEIKIVYFIVTIIKFITYTNISVKSL
jgi:hypothetical protein